MRGDDVLTKNLGVPLSGEAGDELLARFDRQVTLRQPQSAARPWSVGAAEQVKLGDEPVLDPVHLDPFPVALAARRHEALRDRSDRDPRADLEDVRGIGV